jgi:hypothetical protein
MIFRELCVTRFKMWRLRTRGLNNLTYYNVLEPEFCFTHDIKALNIMVISILIFIQTGTLTEDGLDLWGTVPTADNW